MQLSTNFCRIDGPYGYKWPKLSELHYKLFKTNFCLLYTSDAADERSSVDLGGRRIIKKKNNVNNLDG